MKLEILLPFDVFATVPTVERIIAETRSGAFALLPHRRDCLATLAPGILTYMAQAQTFYLAVDQGLLIKRGADVTVAVRRCIQGTTLTTLHEIVAREFLVLSEQELAARNAMTRMEGGFLGRFAELRHE